MNCFNHPSASAIATCQDCQKGLCEDCGYKYKLPICTECNTERIKKKRNE